MRSNYAPLTSGATNETPQTPSLSTLEQSKLLALQTKLHRAQSCAFWFTVICAPVSLLGALAALYGLGSLVDDQFIPSYPSSSQDLSTDVKILGSGGGISATFFGAYKYGKHKMAEIKPLLDQVDAELKARSSSTYHTP